MASAIFSLSDGMTVEHLKANFHMHFLLSWRVYKSLSCKGAMVDDSATLGSIRTKGKKDDEILVGSNLKVANFEKKMAEVYGIGVQVANADDSKLVNNNITLAAAGK